MNNDQQARPEFSREFSRLSPQPPGPFAKLLAFMLSALLLVLAFMFSLVALAVVAVAGIALWGYIWWKTRALRRQMQAQRDREAQVIEGEFFRDTDHPDRHLR